MRVIYAVAGAILVTAGYAAALYRMDEAYKLQVRETKRQGTYRFLTDMTGFTAVLAFVFAAAAGFWRLADFVWPERVLTLFLLWGLSVLSVTDSRTKRVPNRFLLWLLAVWAAVMAVYIVTDPAAGTALCAQALAGGLAGGAVFLLCYLLSGRQVGAGDVKLVCVLGLYLTGRRIMGAVFYGTIFCCVYCLVQLGRKKLGMKDGVALVPFLFAGTGIALLVL